MPYLPPRSNIGRLRVQELVQRISAGNCWSWGSVLLFFSIYTQGEIFNTWVTYATGLAAAVPAFLRVFAVFRGERRTEA